MERKLILTGTVSQVSGSENGKEKTNTRDSKSGNQWDSIYKLMNVKSKEYEGINGRLGKIMMWHF